MVAFCFFLVSISLLNQLVSISVSHANHPVLLRSWFNLQYVVFKLFFEGRIVFHFPYWCAFRLLYTSSSTSHVSPSPIFNVNCFLMVCRNLWWSVFIESTFVYIFWSVTLGGLLLAWPFVDGHFSESFPILPYDLMMILYFWCRTVCPF